MKKAISIMITVIITAQLMAQTSKKILPPSPPAPPVEIQKVAPPEPPLPPPPPEVNKVAPPKPPKPPKQKKEKVIFVAPVIVKDEVI